MKEYIDKSPATDEREQLRQQILDLVGRYAEVAHAPKAFVAGQSAVAVSGKVYGASEMQALVDSALDFWLTTAVSTSVRETARRFLGVHHALTCNSGSSANLLAMRRADQPHAGDRAFKPGDEVITCAAGFPTTVNPLLQNGSCRYSSMSIFRPTTSTRRLDRGGGHRKPAPSWSRIRSAIRSISNGDERSRRSTICVVEDSCDALRRDLRRQDRSARSAISGR